MLYFRVSTNAAMAALPANLAMSFTPSTPDRSDLRAEGCKALTNSCDECEN